MKKQNHYYKDYEKALLKQKERYKKRIESMLKKDFYNCYFLTFTFTEKTLKKTTQKSRLRYIKAYLNKQAKEYMLNCDYGKIKESLISKSQELGREHYHAFILSRYKVILSDEFTQKNKRYGFLYYQKIHDTINRIYGERNAPTIERLTNHAFKDTTKESKIIYSRKSNKINYRFSRKANQKLKNYQATEKAQFIKSVYNADKETAKEILKERIKYEEKLINNKA